MVSSVCRQPFSRIELTKPLASPGREYYKRVIPRYTIFIGDRSEPWGGRDNR